MKKTLLLLALFAILGFGAMKYLQSDKSLGTVDESFEEIFAIKDTDDIHKIFLADRKGNQTTLTRKGDRWILNGKHLARETAMENILDAMSRVRVKFRPSNKATDFLVKNLSTVGIKVEAYDKNGDKIKAYYVGGSSQDENGATMILEGSEEPLVGYIPNWVGTLYNRFSLIGEEWRDRAVFNETVEEIKTLKVEYIDPEYLKHSFEINKEGKDQFSVKPIYATTPVKKEPLVQGKIEAYLVQYESKIAEAFRNEHEDRKQLSAQPPFVVITLTNTKDEEKRVKFFPIIPEDLVTGKENSEVVRTNRPVFRYFAEVNGEDFVLVQQGVFGSLFWSYDQFF